MPHVILLAERPAPGVTIALGAAFVVALLAALLGVLAARPVSRRRHARLAGTTVDLQEIVGDSRTGDVLPAGRGRRAVGRAPTHLQPVPGVHVSTPRLVDLVGAEHPVTAVGRHRSPLTLPGRRGPRRLPLAYWEAYLSGVEVPVLGGTGDRSADAEKATRPEQAAGADDAGTTDPATDGERSASQDGPAAGGEAKPESRWYDDAPDGRSPSRRRSAVLARAPHAGDLSGWWNTSPKQGRTSGVFDDDEQHVPAAFWGTATGPAGPVGRQVSVVDLGGAPRPLPRRRPAAEEPVVEPTAEPTEEPTEEPTAEPTAEQSVAVEPTVEQPAEPLAVEQPADLLSVAEQPAVPHQRGDRQPSETQRLVLRRALRRFADAGDRFDIAQVACEESLEIVEADVASLVVRSVEGPRVLRQDPPGQGIWGAKTLQALMNLGRPLRKLIEGDPLSAGGQTALLVVPVPAAGTLAGTLVVRRVGGRAFSPAEQDSLDRLGRMAGAALDVASRRGQAIGGSQFDPATGLAQRERLVEDLRAALLTVQTHGMAMSLVAVEVTGLAALRERVGGSAADEALSTVVATVTGMLRVGDIAYRLGADEIAVLLPATESTAAPAVARRVADGVTGLGLAPHGVPVSARAVVVPVAGAAGDVVDEAVRLLAETDRPTADA